ncbi:MAG: hypothetical protein KJZ53_07435 [Anaerolineales bacterium]|nr:hypothetical protein [Anaerolineales bacterium]MCL4258342.1 hypothetical protein [Anaerolineales bacterium]
MERNIGKGIRIGLLAVIGFVVFFTVGGLAVQGLWNWLLPELFGWPQVSFWQALGLLVLSRILFGGIGGPGGRGRGRKGKRGPKGHWGPPHLSDEEREHLKHVGHHADEGADEDSKTM